MTGSHDSQQPFGQAHRRGFLRGLGATAGATLLATADRAQAAAQPVRQAASQGLAGIQQLIAGREAVTWVFTGDSLSGNSIGWRTMSEHFAERVRGELNRTSDVVVSTATSGDRAAGLLAALDARALALRPQVVSIALGMQDSIAGASGRESFRGTLRTIVARVQAAGAIAVLHTPNSVSSSASSHHDLPAYAQVVREVAAEQGVVVVDHFAHWQSTKPQAEDLASWLADGASQPGVYGQRALAHEMFRTLGIFDVASPTCRLALP